MIQTITKHPFYLLLSILGLLFLTGCYENVIDVNSGKITIPGPEIVEEFPGNLTVTVEDLNGNIIEDVDVHVYDNVEETNKHGIAHFENIPLDKSGTVVRAYKPGFLYGTATFNPIGTGNYITMKVLPILNLTVFNSNDNVSISVDGGGKVDITSGSFEYLDGSPYNGEVEIVKHLIAETDNNYHDILPGDHTGLAKNGSLKNIEIYSAVAVFAFDVEGIELQLREGKSLRVELPLNPDNFEIIPDQAKAWNFDQGKSTWVEEELAFKDGNTMWSELSNLGFWSFAKNHNFIHITAEVLGGQSEALSHLTVSYKHNGVVASGITDEEGKVYLRIPENQEITLSITHPACSETIFDKVIPALVDDHLLETITLNVESLGRIRGNINCQMTPIPFATFFCRTQNGSYQYTTDENGDFDILLSEALCNNDVLVEITAIDPETSNESPQFSYSNSADSPFVLDVCADCEFDVEIMADLLDPCDLLVQLNAMVSNGSGDYSFEWEDNSAGMSTTVTTNANFCITVTDNVTECVVESCTNIVAPEDFISSITQSNNISCQENGLVEITAVGGILPYSYNWEGPNGFSSQESLISNLLVEGTYSYTITDGNECVAEGNQMILSEVSTYTLDVSTTDLNNVICGDVTKTLVLDCQGCFIDLSLAEWILPDGNSAFGSEIQATQMGIYEVSIQELNCVAEGSIQLQKVDFVEPVLDFSCDNGTYDVSMGNLDIGFSTTLAPIDYEFLIEQFQEAENGNYSVISPYVTCEREYEYVLPKYNGFTLDVNDTSCDGCVDGSISIETEDDCTNCVFENYYIYAQGDYQSDYNTANLEQLMPAGNYYVVAKSNDGCVLNSIALTID